MNRFQRIIAGAALMLLVLSSAAVQAASPKVRETVIAGSPDHFMEARHVVLKGSDFEIGKQMAAVAMREGIKARKSSNRLLSRCKRLYFARNYPAHIERMKGTAAAFGLPFEDDQYDFSGLWQSSMPAPACSAVFYPGSSTENGHSLLSRNYDFITGTLRGTAPKPGERAVMARPYLIEMHPNKGYASLAMSAFDILGESWMASIRKGSRFRSWTTEPRKRWEGKQAMRSAFTRSSACAMCWTTARPPRKPRRRCFP